MGDGIQAMQITERIKITDNMTALQMAEQQRLRSNVDEFSKEFMSYATVTTASVQELHKNMVISCQRTQQELH
eukprot:11095035-Lingulodinium_polyedra.AAC.1